MIQPFDAHTLHEAPPPRSGAHATRNAKKSSRHPAKCGESAALREQVRTLLAEVQELRGQLAKDSHHSSKPPASDGLGRKTKSLRKRTGRKPGGQPGHRGHQVRLVAVPDMVVVHRP